MSGAAGRRGRHPASQPRLRAAARWALAAMAATILAATLRPSSDLTVYEIPTFCILCGARGASDALANLILFVPFGALLVVSGGRSALRLCAAGAALSLGIETAQAVIPGRDPSLGDLLFNTAGTALGVALALRAAWWTDPAARARPALIAAATAAAVLLVGATGVLLEPAGTAQPYYGQWTPEQGHLELYEGRVLEVTVGGLAVEDGPIEETARVRELLARGAAVSILAIVGPAVPGLASLFSIMDRPHQEILLIGPDRDDALVVRYRLRAAALLLDGPGLRLPGALAALAPGDTLRVAVWREPGRPGRCIEVNGAAHCGLGFTAARGWSLLMYPDRLPAWAQRLLDLVWVAGIALPAGVWAVKRRELAAAGLAVLGALALVPFATELLPTTPADLAAAAAGVVAGSAAGRLLRRRLRRAAGP